MSGRSMPAVAQAAARVAEVDPVDPVLDLPSLLLFEKSGRAATGAPLPHMRFRAPTPKF
jgi:hypothetical protein